MNGRAYDYNLGRFLSVDPFVQAPGNSQSMNPYSYIMNNPLAGTDPSGYKWVTIWDHETGTMAELASIFSSLGFNVSNGKVDLSSRRGNKGLVDLAKILSPEKRLEAGLTRFDLAMKERGSYRLLAGTEFIKDFSYKDSELIAFNDSALTKQMERESLARARGEMDYDEWMEIQKARGIGMLTGGVVAALGLGTIVKESAQAGVESTTGVDLSWIPSVKNVLKKGFKRSIGELGQGVARPTVSDPKLGNLMKDLYKGANTKNPVGTGSTADAIRQEILTGVPVGGKFHTQKGQQYVNALTKWLKKNQNASAADRNAAQAVLDDLSGALKGVK